MANILNYTKTNTKSFDEVPFNAVDSLVLSTIAYIDFSDLFKIEYSYKIKDIPVDKIDKSKVNLRDSGKYVKLFNYFVNNPRYNNGILRDYVLIQSNSDETHFNAMTFVFDDFSYVAYMGTGANLIDWKEDFNLVYKRYVPAQKYAKKYLDKMMSLLSGKFYVGGHSKGGNLSCYSASYTKLWNRLRIEEIFSHDGPGFNKHVYNSINYITIKNKINKTLPSSSLVGMLLYSRASYKVIKSNAISFFQHSPFSWLVKNNDFIYLDDRAWDSKYMDKVLTSSIDSLSKKELEIFINAAFNILSKVDYDSIDINKNRFFNIIRVLKKGTKNLDQETKVVVNKVLDKFSYYRKLHFKLVDKKSYK